MATNLRLREEAVAALQHYAARTGLSQQEILRRALDAYLKREAGVPGSDAAVRSDSGGTRAGILPPRHPFMIAEHLVELPHGVTTADLLDREDRI